MIRRTCFALADGYISPHVRERHGGLVIAERGYEASEVEYDNHDDDEAFYKGRVGGRRGVGVLNGLIL